MWASAGAFVIIFILGLALAFTTAGAVEITGIVLVFVGMIGGLVLSVSGAAVAPAPARFEHSSASTSTGHCDGQVPLLRSRAALRGEVQ